jgi:serine/threonine protein kinase
VVKYTIGDVIGERFKVLKVLGGEGITGIGVVYVVEDSKNENKVIAIKTLQDQFLELEKKVKTFKQEALSWVLLDHYPYVVNAFFVINIDNRPYIALEYIAPDNNDRNTLSDYLKEEISLKQALQWAIEVCSAMVYCASRGLTPHRDIKPDNIMITSDKIAKVTDFGLAKFIVENRAVIDLLDMEDVDDLEASLLRVSAATSDITGGSVPWMAPEQFEGKPDMRSDIYSFGVVLYQMVNKGKRPFRKFSIREFYKAHLSERPPPLKSKLWPIIEKCLKKKSENRYQKFSELREDLEDLFNNMFGEKPVILAGKERLDAEERFNKGISFQALGFIDEAIAEYNHAIRLDPNYFNAYVNLGDLYMEKGILTFAMEEFQNALKINHDSIKVHKKLAKTYFEMRRSTESIKEYLVILTLDPKDVKIYLELAAIHELIRDYETALSLNQKFIDQAPSDYSKDIKTAKRAIKRIGKIKKQNK